MSDIPTAIASLRLVIKNDLPRPVRLPGGDDAPYPSPAYHARRAKEQENNHRNRVAKVVALTVALLEEEHGTLPRINEEEVARVLQKALDALNYEPTTGSKVSASEAFKTGKENVAIAFDLARKANVEPLRVACAYATFHKIRRTIGEHVEKALAIAKGDNAAANREHYANGLLLLHGWKDAVAFDVEPHGFR